MKTTYLGTYSSDHVTHGRVLINYNHTFRHSVPGQVLDKKNTLIHLLDSSHFMKLPSKPSEFRKVTAKQTKQAATGWTDNLSQRSAYLTHQPTVHDDVCLRVTLTSSPSYLIEYTSSSFPASITGFSNPLVAHLWFYLGGGIPQPE